MSSFESLQRRVFALELELRLFERRFLGAPVWKLLRIHIQRGLAEATGLLSPEAVRQRKVRTVSRLTFSDIATFVLCLLSGRCDVVVIPAETRFRTSCGYIDPITAPLLSDLDPSKSAILDLSPIRVDVTRSGNGHRRVISGSVIRSLSELLQKMIWRCHRISRRLRSARRNTHDIERLSAELTDRLGSIAEPLRKVPGYIVGQALDYKANRLLYLVVFWWLQPRVIVLTVSYGKEALIDAARRVGARVVEIQHGVIAPYHMGYSFPFAREKTAAQQNVAGLPDLLLLSGPAWAEEMEFHPNTKIAICGSDLRLEQKSTEADNSDRVLIVSSQPLVGDALINIVTAIARHFEHEKVTVRVHPNQSIDYSTATSALGLDNVEIDTAERPIWEALLESKFVVTGPSTVLFQAIALQCATIVVRSNLDSWLEPFLQGAGVTFVSGPADVVRAMGAVKPASHGERFFSAREKSLLETILHELDLTNLQVRRATPAA